MKLKDDKYLNYVEPPYYNMGVEPTSEYKENPTCNRVSKDLECLIDWLSFTIKKNIPVDYIITHFLKMNSAEGVTGGQGTPCQGRSV